jgi:hypothetical protein
VEILPSARKHGVSDDDIRHAVLNALAAIRPTTQPGFVMFVGPDQNTNMLEIGVLDDDDEEYVIHAMRARPQYLRLGIQE